MADAHPQTRDRDTATALSGVIPPLVTPLNAAREPDRASLDRLVEHVIDAGVRAVLVLGSTGEGAHLLPDQQQVVVETAVAITRGRVPVLAGVPALGTRSAVETARRLTTAGPDYLLVPPPSGFDLSQPELADHFRAVKDATDIALLAYQVPSRVPTRVMPQLVTDLAGEGVICGIKDSSQDLQDHREYTHATSSMSGFRRLTGNELGIDAALFEGFHGAVPGLANVWPHMHVGLLEAARRSDWCEAAKTQRDITAYMDLYAPPTSTAGSTAAVVAALKEALVQKGIVQCSTMTVPFRHPGPALRHHVANLLARFQESKE